MFPEYLFQALAEIAREHGYDQADLLVVPVLTDELESRRALLSEAAQFLGGSLLDATIEEDAEVKPIAGYQDPLLQGAVEAGLTFDRPGLGTTRVELTHFDGL